MERYPSQVWLLVEIDPNPNTFAKHSLATFGVASAIDMTLSPSDLPIQTMSLLYRKVS